MAGHNRFLKHGMAAASELMRTCFHKGAHSVVLGPCAPLAV